MNGTIVHRPVTVDNGVPSCQISSLLNLGKSYRPRNESFTDTHMDPVWCGERFTLFIP